MFDISWQFTMNASADCAPIPMQTVNPSWLGELSLSALSEWGGMEPLM